MQGLGGGQCASDGGTAARIADARATRSTLCLERIGDVQWKYVAKGQVLQSEKLFPHQSALAEIMDFVRSHVVPEGFPDSVLPCYTPYMQWRCLQYFFGGAMGVFTTRSLLHALGVRNGASSSAIAVNWVVKDGAGRIGKMIFARHGKKFDCHLKQIRFAGDVLMQLAAALELATSATPQFFLPLACIANIGKNVAAVASTSTRAPIYKAFARRENIGDITAKGECIGNIADLLGTGMGILMSKNFPVFAPFSALAFGYVYSSFREVKAIQLPTLNRHRFGIAVDTFLETGKVPGLVEANERERIIVGPQWSLEKLELGARVSDAFSAPQDYQYIDSLFKGENYLVSYNPKRQRTYVVLKERANGDDVLRAAFHGQLFVNIFDKCSSAEGAYQESCKYISPLYEHFKLDAEKQGWIMSETLLSPGNARVCT
ncbi:protein root UVB sensitive 6-like isoform X1 [Selaginella moellendorffii]|uniref:protein root UVB sensitive 6-like isoform X1 n=1 Tax=Selaginella moellendorffii TaxID=88036 RepID=UPI000D1C68E9|nr:protein root UVB sensitive 6-like isoform X1 [Selaginella moellendorffii]|eukprot:XP_024523497.1 protein root UVB sensitive 6-like isoform X1 [Selaginella moellendorffii]